MPPKPGASPYSPSAAPAAAAVSTSVEPHAQISISAAPSSAATTPAATAKESGATIVTFNTKRFAAVRGLTVIKP